MEVVLVQRPEGPYRGSNDQHEASLFRLDFIQAACGACNAFVPTTSARNFPTTVQMSTCIFSVICSPLTPCDDRYYRHSQPTSQFQPCDPDLGYDKKTLMLILKMSDSQVEI
ncbi:hypothetical protein ABKN59_005322 [Abortiporus biennis]